MERKTNLRVLFVEDDLDSCEMVEAILGTANIHVTHSYSVEDAWKQASIDAFDLYLLDGTVRDGTTLGLCSELHKVSPRTPILFYSGLASQSDIQAGMNAGAHAYLVKPYFGDLAEAVSDALASGRLS